MEEKMKTNLIVGTRKSKLAMAQTELAIAAIQRHVPDVECRIHAIQTTGDKILNQSLVSFGGKGIFIEEFERNLQDGSIDIAVHSAKDMPAKLGEGLKIAATLVREDPRDVLIWRKGEHLEEKERLLIGTGSKRREIQVKRFYPCECRLLRGNVNTRLEKLDNKEYDAIILAAAGLKRSHLSENSNYQYRYFSTEELVPSGGQGIIAIESRADGETERIFQKITDWDSYYRLAIERYLLDKLQAGCHEPLGVYTEITGDRLCIRLMDGRSGEARYFVKEYQIKGLEELVSHTTEHTKNLAEKFTRMKEELLSQAYRAADDFLYQM